MGYNIECNKILKDIECVLFLAQFFLNSIEVMRIVYTKKLGADYKQYTYFSKWVTAMSTGDILPLTPWATAEYWHPNLFQLVPQVAHILLLLDYSSVYFNLYVFGQQIWEHKVLNWTVILQEQTVCCLWGQLEQVEKLVCCSCPWHEAQCVTSVSFWAVGENQVLFQMREISSRNSCKPQYAFRGWSC